MNRVSLAGLLTSFACVSVVFGQPGAGMVGQGFQLPPTVDTAPYESPLTYVYSEQVTCTCGTVNENFLGGPRACSNCGQTLPAPPSIEPSSVEPASAVSPVVGSEAVTTAEYHPQPGQPTVAPVDYTFAEICAAASNIGSGRNRGASSILDHLAGCLSGSRSPVDDWLMMTPNMFGGGWGAGTAAIGGSNFQATQPVNINLVATGTLIGPSAGINSVLDYNVLGNVENPDFQSVGVGALVGGLFQFNINEAIPAPTGLYPPGSTFTSGTATQQAAGAIANGQQWDIALSLNQTTTQFLIPNAANAGAAVVGRTRISDNNSPLPRTRVYFNYDLLGGVPLRTGGVDVNRFTPGLEYAIGNCSSIEFRAPFAASLSSDVLTNGTTPQGRAEFGDFFMAYKRILLKTTDCAISGGVSVTLPTTNDLTIADGAGTTFLVVQNEAVHIMPFFASIAKLTDRLFYQGFLQFDFDANGSRVFRPGAGNIGRLQDVSRLYSSGALGYWLCRRGDHPNAYFSAIIPTVEFHFEHSLESTNAFQIATGGGNSIVLGNNGVKTSSTTVVFGNTFEITPSEAISVGYSAPVGNSSDQFFDGQLRVMWNRFF